MGYSKADKGVLNNKEASKLLLVKKIDLTHISAEAARVQIKIRQLKFNFTFNCLIVKEKVDFDTAMSFRD